MRKNKGNLAGILGTIIIHLIAGIIFMSLQLSSLQKALSKEYEVELAPVPETVIKKEKIVEVPATSVEKVLKGDEEMLNIARNLSSKPAEKINASDYIDKVKDELIKSGKLGVDNYIDEQKKQNESKGDENLTVEKDTIGEKVKAKPKASQEMAANYKGPTRIYYDLIGRNHLYLPIPIYKCEGSGKVVLSIEVDQNGVVEKAQIAERESTVTDPCLVETAINTALLSRFNPDASSPRIQLGMLTYEFVAQ
jgi:outer membrane biosynthesis protein TonB